MLLGSVLQEMEYDFFNVSLTEYSISGPFILKHIPHQMVWILKLSDLGITWHSKCLSYFVALSLTLQWNMIFQMSDWVWKNVSFVVCIF